MIVPLAPEAQKLFFGIEYFNVDRLFGWPIGALKWPMLISLLFAAISFAVGAYYLFIYTRGFFAVRKIPKSWKFIVWGIAITTIAEIGQMLGFYEWPYPGFVEIVFLLVLPHAFGGTLIGIGAYYLYKEIKV